MVLDHVMLDFVMPIHKQTDLPANKELCWCFPSHPVIIHIAALEA